MHDGAQCSESDPRTRRDGWFVKVRKFKLDNKVEEEEVRLEEVCNQLSDNISQVHARSRGHDLSTPSYALLVVISYIEKNLDVSNNWTAYIAKIIHAFAIYAVQLPDISITII